MRRRQHGEGWQRAIPEDESLRGSEVTDEQQQEWEQQEAEQLPKGRQQEHAGFRRPASSGQLAGGDWMWGWLMLLQPLTALNASAATCMALLAAAVAVAAYTFVGMLVLMRTFTAPAAHTVPLYFDYSSPAAVAIAQIAPPALITASTSFYDELDPGGSWNSDPTVPTSGTAAAGAAVGGAGVLGAMGAKAGATPVMAPVVVPGSADPYRWVGKVQVTVHLEMPQPQHEELFQLTGEMLTSGGRTVARSVTTYLPRHQPWLWKLIKLVRVAAPPRLPQEPPGRRTCTALHFHSLGMLVPLSGLAGGSWVARFRTKSRHATLSPCYAIGACSDTLAVRLPLFRNQVLKPPASPAQAITQFRATLVSRSAGAGQMAPPAVHSAHATFTFQTALWKRALYWLLRPSLPLALALGSAAVTIGFGSGMACLGCGLLAIFLYWLSCQLAVRGSVYESLANGADDEAEVEGQAQPEMEADMRLEGAPEVKQEVEVKEEVEAW